MTTPTNGFTKEICLKKGTKLFLDIKNSSKFDLYLKKIGVVVDEFLSKEVDYVVTDSRTIATNHGGTHAKKFLHDGLHKSLTSRGQTLLMKSVNYPASQACLDPMQFALKFNIPVVYVADLKKALLFELASLKKNKKTPIKSGGIVKLDKNFIKVEDLSMQFIPLFKKIHHGTNSIENCSLKKANEEAINVQKGDLGYCECCEEICDDFAIHRKGSAHKSFVAKTENFLSLDNLISTLPPIDQLKALPTNENCQLFDNEKEISSSTVPAEVSSIQNLREANKITPTKSNCAIIRPWEIAASSKSNHFEVKSLAFNSENETLVEQDSTRYFKDTVVCSSKILPTFCQQETSRLDGDCSNVTTKNFPSVIQKEPLSQCLDLNVSNFAFYTTSAKEAKTCDTPEFDHALSHFLQHDTCSNELLDKSCPTQSNKSSIITLSDNGPNQDGVLIDGSNCHSFKPVCHVPHFNFEFSKIISHNDPSRSSSDHVKPFPKVSAPKDFLSRTKPMTTSHYSLSNPSIFPDALYSTVPHLCSKPQELRPPSCDSMVKQKFKRLSLRNKYAKVNGEKAQIPFLITSGERVVTSTSCSVSTDHSVALQKHRNSNLAENFSSVRKEKTETCENNETVLWSSKLTSDLKMLFTRIGKAPVPYC